MRLYYGIVLVALILGVVFWPAQQVRAQSLDSVYVEWDTEGDGVPVPNALRNFILTDTLADGSHRQDRVYKLRKGGFYWNEDIISNSGFHLRLVGDPADPSDPLFGNPPVIQMVTRSGGGDPGGRIITGSGSTTLKNIYFIGCDDNGVQTYYQPIQFGGSGQRFYIDNCIFERSNFAFMAWTGKDNDIFITNCKFRNLIGRPSTQQWEGRGVSLWNDQDTVVVENNTFLLIHSFPFQLEGGAANYVRMNHNTFVNAGRQICQGSWWQEAYITNNLIVNGFWHGEGWSDINGAGRDPDQYTTGMFILGNLPSKYGPNEGRKILLANMAAYRYDVFDNWYADSLRAQPFLGTLSWRDWLNEYDGMVAMDTQWVDPGLNTVFEAALYDSMILGMNTLRHNITPAADYMWMIPQVEGEDCNVCPIWPLPEDFTYTNTDLLTAATDDLPLGDLNWYPTAKATWEANKAQFIKDIEGMVVVPEYDIVASMEAEDGTLGGDATVDVFSGFSYYRLAGGGYIEWEFEMPEAATVDFVIGTSVEGRGMSGNHILFNGTKLHENGHCWGEFVIEPARLGFDPYGWGWIRYTPDSMCTAEEVAALDLAAGTNVIRIEPGWGEQRYAGFDIIKTGTEDTLIKLRAPDVTAHDVVTPGGVGAPWVPSEFKAVNLNSTGSITWGAVNTPSDGNYLLRVFYQNYGSPVGGQILLDGSPVADVTFESDADSAGLDFLSDDFPVTAGTHDVAMATTAQTLAKIDNVQYIQVTFLAIKRRPVVPDGYALEQNYPNPFNPTTNINFALGKASNVKLVIYNVLGQKVVTLIDQRMNPGAYSVQFDASRFASGIYFYRIEAGEFVSEKKMVLLK